MKRENLGGKTRYKSFQEMIAYWLKELGLIDSFEISEIGEGSNLYRAYVKKDKDSTPALLTDVGFGYLKFFPHWYSYIMYQKEAQSLWNNLKFISTPQCRVGWQI
ncbi:hypothetical protein VRB21_20065 [Pseudomonas poae]